MATTIGGPGGFVETQILAETPEGREQLKNIALTCGTLAAGALAPAAGAGLGGTALSVGATRFGTGAALGESIGEAMDAAVQEGILTYAGGKIIGSIGGAIVSATKNSAKPFVIAIGKTGYSRLPDSMKKLFTVVHSPGVPDTYAMKVDQSMVGRVLSGDGSKIDEAVSLLTGKSPKRLSTVEEGEEIIKDVRKLFNLSKEQETALKTAYPEMWNGAKRIPVVAGNADHSASLSGVKISIGRSTYGSRDFANHLGHEFGFHAVTEGNFGEPLGVYPRGGPHTHYGNPDLVELWSEALNKPSVERFAQVLSETNGKAYPEGFHDGLMGRMTSRQALVKSAEYYGRNMENAARIYGSLSELGTTDVNELMKTFNGSYKNFFVNPSDGNLVPGFGHERVPTFIDNYRNTSYVHGYDTNLDSKGGDATNAAEKSQDYTAHSESTAPTDEQLQEAVEFLEMVMEIGAPQNEWEQSIVQRTHDVLVEALKSKSTTAQASIPEDEPTEKNTQLDDKKTKAAMGAGVSADDMFEYALHGGVTTYGGDVTQEQQIANGGNNTAESTTEAKPTEGIKPPPVAESKPGTGTKPTEGTASTETPTTTPTDLSTPPEGVNSYSWASWSQRERQSYLDKMNNRGTATDPSQQEKPRSAERTHDKNGRYRASWAVEEEEA